MVCLDPKNKEDVGEKTFSYFPQFKNQSQQTLYGGFEHFIFMEDLHPTCRLTPTKPLSLSKKIYQHCFSLIPYFRFYLYSLKYWINIHHVGVQLDPIKENTRD